jgi:hypothetical protein
MNATTGFALMIPLVLACVFACAKPHGAALDGSAAATPESDPCTAAKLSLGAATPATDWKAPDGCVPSGSTGAPPTLVRNDAEFSAAFSCTGNTMPGIDFSKNALVIENKMLSPAGVGSSVFDDGKTITIVDLFRDNCPSDPIPMPIAHTRTVLVPAGGERTFAKSTCKLAKSCD